MSLLTHDGQEVHSARLRTQAPVPKPRGMPFSARLYAQVVKTVRRRRPVVIQHRIMFGTFSVGQPGLAAYGWQINTAFLARLNGDTRQHINAVGRQVNTLCMGEDRVWQQLG